MDYILTGIFKISLVRIYNTKYIHKSGQKELQVKWNPAVLLWQGYQLTRPEDCEVYSSNQIRTLLLTQSHAHLHSKTEMKEEKNV